MSFASRNGIVEVVKYLISADAYKDTKEYKGYTHLIYASESCHFVVVKYLISSGADKEVKDNLMVNSKLLIKSSILLVIVKQKIVTDIQLSFGHLTQLQYFFYYFNVSQKEISTQSTR